MPLNPFTGEFEGYDSPSTQAGMGMAAMSATGMEIPLAFRMLENAPGIFSTMGYSAFRGSSTLMRGGSGQVGVVRSSMSRGSARMRNLLGGNATSLNVGENRFFSTTATRGDYFRSGRVGSGRAPFLRPALRNNFPRLRNFGQFTDLSIFADAKYSRYTPFGFSSFVGNNLIGSSIANKMGIKDLAPGESAFGPGLFSALSAGVRTDRLEARAISRIKNGKDANKIFSKLDRVSENITTLAKMNAPNISGASSSQIIATARVASPKVGMGAPAQQRIAQARAIPNALGSAVSVGNQAGTVGVRGNVMASTMAGGGTKFILGYARGALGFGGVDGLVGRAADGAKLAQDDFIKSFTQNFGDDGMRLRSGSVIKSSDEAINFLRSSGGGNFFRELGARNTVRLAASTSGSKFLAARAGALAIPGLNVVATAALVYDLGKMAGEVVKSGIELARDAGKSMQGTIAKPAFGMGYRDTEAAATSRARGVMAIQNSRLNMRSLLGSEAAMLAAHYG